MVIIKVDLSNKNVLVPKMTLVMLHRTTTKEVSKPRMPRVTSPPSRTEVRVPSTPFNRLRRTTAPGSFFLLWWFLFCFWAKLGLGMYLDGDELQYNF